MKHLISGILLGLLVACAQTGDAIGGGYVSIETAAEAITRECGNAEPGGDCVADSLITTAKKEELAAQLQEAKNYLDSAARLYGIGMDADAGDALQKALAMLDGVSTELKVQGIE